MIADEVVNKVYVQAGTIGADGVFTALPKLGVRRIWCGLKRIQFLFSLLKIIVKSASTSTFLMAFALW